MIELFCLSERGGLSVLQNSQNIYMSLDNLLKNNCELVPFVYDIRNEP